MSDEKKELPAASDVLQNSSLHRESQAEPAEVLKHKPGGSVETSRDIGFELALTDWIIEHRSKWRKSRQSCPT